MAFIQKLMNCALPPITLFVLIFFLPLILAFKFLTSVKRSICSENLAGKIVLITGAASGIGEQLAYEYSRRGAHLVLIDIKEENLGSVCSKARSLGSPEAISIGADISKVEDCQRFINQAVLHFGRLDHLVNNAGIATMGAPEDAQFSNQLRQMDVNYWGAVYITHFAIPHLRKTKGKIVVIASTLGWFSLPKFTGYSESKAALINFFETLKTELGWTIGITIVTPGVIKTKMTQGVGMETLASIPAESAERCAKAIVKSACRGDMYLTVPSWVRSLFLLKSILPELTALVVHWLFMPKTKSSKKNTAYHKAE